MIGGFVLSFFPARRIFLFSCIGNLCNCSHDPASASGNRSGLWGPGIFLTDFVQSSICNGGDSLAGGAATSFYRLAAYGSRGMDLLLLHQLRFWHHDYQHQMHC